MTARMASITDVARRAGVSVATVSRVMNGGYPVAEPTRLRVQQAITDLGYVANAHARALTRSSTRTVGVILHDAVDPYFAQIVSGIQEEADVSGRMVLLLSTMRDRKREVAQIELLRAQRVDAVIIIGGFYEDDEFVVSLQEQARGLKAQGARLIVCGPYPIRAQALIPDNAGGAFRLTTYLLEQGHRRIAHLAGPQAFSTAEERHSGYRGALSAYGATYDPNLVIRTDFSRDGAYAACMRLLDSGESFSAIFAANDIMAIGTLSALRDRSIAVPADVSVVGFDDILISRDLTPRLTTMSIPMEQLGRRAMELAVSPDADPYGREDVPTTLVVRDSVARVSRSRFS
jgi:LacI family transcriptional regulator